LIAAPHEVMAQEDINDDEDEIIKDKLIHGNTPL